jgi:hypothetical protein
VTQRPITVFPFWRSSQRTYNVRPPEQSEKPAVWHSVHTATWKLTRMSLQRKLWSAKRQSPSQRLSILRRVIHPGRTSSSSCKLPVGFLHFDSGFELPAGNQANHEILLFLNQEVHHSPSIPSPHEPTSPPHCRNSSAWQEQPSRWTSWRSKMVLPQPRNTILCGFEFLARMPRPSWAHWAHGLAAEIILLVLRMLHGGFAPR